MLSFLTSTISNMDSQDLSDEDFGRQTNSFKRRHDLDGLQLLSTLTSGWRAWHWSISHCASFLYHRHQIGLDLLPHVIPGMYLRVWSSGTSSIVHEKTHQPLLSTLASVVETVIHLRSQGHKVILVSSGAIGVGLKRMELENKPKSLSGKQVRSAVQSY